MTHESQSHPSRPSHLGYLPGCYRNLRPVPNESFAGFLLRLSEKNGYAGIRDLLGARALATNRPLGVNLIQARASVSAITDLGRMAIGDPKALSHYLVHYQLDRSIFYRECRIAHEAILVDRASICPLCLAEHGWAHEDWDLTAVTVCLSHRVMLRDECAICREPIRWNRSSLHHCSRCGGDYRHQSSVDVAADICEVAADFAALAPFRAKTLDNRIESATWDEMVHVFKALLLPANHWARGTWESFVLTDVPVMRRHHATEALSHVHDRRCYKLIDLRLPAGNSLNPLSAVPRKNMVQQHLYEVLKRSGGLSERVAEAVSGYRVEVRHEAYEVFGGRPPSIHSTAEAARFLGVGMDTFAALGFVYAIPSSFTDEIGLDMDRLLAVQRFLKTGLLTLAEVEAVVGLSMDADDLADSGLLPRWNPRDKADSRVQLDVVVSLHSQLIAYWSEAVCPSDGIKIAELVRNSLKPFRIAAETVRLILSREIGIVGWQPPFTWSTIEVELKTRDFLGHRVGSFPQPATEN